MIPMVVDDDDDEVLSVSSDDASTYRGMTHAVNKCLQEFVPVLYREAQVYFPA